MSAPDELPEQFGRYRILRRLGKGGMGAVYLAEDTNLGRHVALKVPHFDTAAEPQALQRFLREARIVAALRHEHICLVHDLGQFDGIHYLTMEYVEGTRLYDQVGQPWEPRAAVELLRKLASAVHVLHTKGVIHRDLKPGNIMLRPSGEPVLLDFGLARPTAPQDLKLTATDIAVGTPAYMSPEQHRADKDIGPATDIYSLGVILYELLTGQLPFPGPSRAELIGQVMFGKLEPPSRLRPGLDAALDALCLQALARAAAERFATAEKMAAALTAIAGPAPRVPAAAATKVTVRCPACGAKLTAPETALGKQKSCPGCKAPFVVTLPRPADPPEVVTRPEPTLDVVTLDLSKGIGMTFVRIPAAGRKFWMGSPATEASRYSDEDQVEAEFTRDFWMAIHQTTQAQYLAIIGKPNPSHFTKEKDSLQFPVESVPWEDCDACVNDLNRRFAATLAKKLGAHELVFGLPTEAQWEYACRGGATEKTSLPFHFKNGPSATLSSTQANFDGNFPYGTAAKGPYLERTTRVGSYEPNRFGLYDMHGNVSEWCADYYGPLIGGIDPERKTMHDNQDHRVLRGCSWTDAGHDCRAALRGMYVPGFRIVTIGFRLIFRLDL